MPSLNQSELIDAYISAYNRFDVAGMMATLHEDVVFKHVQNGEVEVTVEGRAPLQGMAEDAAKAFAERRQNVVDLRDEGESVVADIEFVARLHDGPRVQGRGRSVFTFADEKIATITDEAS